MTKRSGYGLCACGCGGKTTVAKMTAKKFGRVRGEPNKYIMGHSSRVLPTPTEPNPAGLCLCGCGEKTSIASKTSAANGNVSGKPVRFVFGHNGCTVFSKREGPNPDGLCWCGCGQRTELASNTTTDGARVKGKPLRYVGGHVRRLSPVAYVVVDTGCWVWQRTKRAGYGRAQCPEEKRLKDAHVIHYEQKYGPVPVGLELDHLCRNTLCVNPDHLEAVTHAENTRRGAVAKLSKDEVSEIRTRKAEKQKALAAEYGVAQSTISSIQRYETWKDL